MKWERAEQLFAQNGLSLTETQFQKFSTYQEILVETNRRMNLTTITEDAEVWRKHFLDSCLPFRFVEVPTGAAIIDVGTGAGFPGLPMRILRQDLRLTLLDSLQKRVHFLEAVCQALQMPTKCIHARAEFAGKQPEFREQYDVACARAVAALPTRCEYCLPFVKVGGLFLALKGPNETVEDAENIIATLGGVLEKTYSYALGREEARQLFVIRKERPTPKQYPRSPKQLQNKAAAKRIG
jgi:16S rRNA (guanine527-N7)-methyltransferase